MQKIILILIFVVMAFSCGQSNSDNHSKKVNWYDGLMMDYIKKSDSKLIELSRQDTTINIEWLLERVENADTAKYLIFHIGHDVVDKGDINMRFVTDGWIYIDSLTRKVYEYDSPNDSLIQWKK